MKTFIFGLKDKITLKALTVKALMKSQCGENFVDSAIRILIAVVIGALLLAGLYALFGETVLPTLRQRIIDLFNYSD